MDTQGRLIDLIVIHCSATPNGRWNTVEDVDAWHAARGFQRQQSFVRGFNPRTPHIGYHWVIYTNGARVTGRSVAEVGAHVRGWNDHSVAICVLGTDAFTAAQWDALADQVRFLCGALRVPLQTPDFNAPRPRGVCGHRDFPGVTKTCPGFDVTQWLAAGMPAGRVCEAME